MKQKLLFALLALLVVWQVSAQTGNAAFIVSGQLIDSVSLETVPYATIRIATVQNPSKPVTMLASNIDGKFSIPLKQAGRYIATFQSMGLATKEKTFDLKAGQPVLNLGKIFMSESSIHLEGVTVTAQKPLVKAEIDKITYNMEEDPEAVTNNALDMLRKVPMITVDGDDNIQLKGSTNYKIYLNGKPSNLMTNNPSDVLKSMPANTIKNIEVITEPGAKYDAEGVGGIINITTKSSIQGYTGTVRANADNFGSAGGGAYLSLKAGKFGITGTYNYNYRNSPYTDSYYNRENKRNQDEQYLAQHGRSKRKGPFQYGYLEASYEIDSLNLLSLSANRFDGKMKNLSEMTAEMLSHTFDPVYSYRRNSSSTNNFGDTEVTLDYQHSTRIKDELLTVSYKFSNAPDGSETSTGISDTTGRYPLDYLTDWAKNKASTDEHTGQIDYTRPFGSIHSMEAGAKYIYRNSESKTDRLRDGDPVEERNRNFEHIQHIYSLYGSYTAKVKKFGFKGGVRAEGTRLTVNTDDGFSSHYFDVVPSATVSYQLGMTQNIRFGYNMRIHRPSIWYLNPYVDQTDPEHISHGNKDLDSEKSHNLNLNYSMFTQKLNLNVSASYTFVNNGIQQYSFINDDNVLETTYGNIGHNQQAGLYLYGSWNPVSSLRIFTNASVEYQKLESDEYGTNDGFNYRAFAGVQYSLPYDFRINVNGGYFAPRILLQGKSSSFYFTSFTLNKDFLNKKLTLSVACRDPFWKNKSMKSTSEDAYFYEHSLNYMTGRSFRFSVSYTFGDLKGGIKKVKRSITNDDVKAGGGEGGEGESM